MKRTLEDGTMVVVSPAFPNARHTTPVLYRGALLAPDHKVLFGALGSYEQCIQMCHKAYNEIQKED